MTKLNDRFPVYSKLLRLYPIEYQREYSSQMLQTLADMLDDRNRSKALTWTRTALDYPISVAYQQISFTGAAMKNETPSYLKRNAIAGALLLVPFFIFITLNSLINHGLPDSNAWNRFYWMLLVILPLVAFALNASSFFRWSLWRRRQSKTSFWKSLLDVRHNWQTVTIGGLALLITLFVPFHDSTHCITGNPVREAHNFHQTVQCIQRG